MNSKNDLKNEIGKRITEIRIRMNMSKNEFARLIGMKNQYLGDVERGKKGLTIEKVINICNLTGVTADYILFGVENKFKYDLQNVLSNYSSTEIETAKVIVTDPEYWGDDKVDRDTYIVYEYDNSDLAYAVQIIGSWSSRF